MTIGFSLPLIAIDMLPCMSLMKMLREDVLRPRPVAWSSRGWWFSGARVGAVNQSLPDYELHD